MARRKAPRPTSQRRRKAREDEALFLARLGRAMDAIFEARQLVREHGLGEVTETAVITALSELDQAERINDAWCDRR